MPVRRLPPVLGLATLAIALAGLAAPALHASDAPGLKIYKNLCASCHGDDGQGVRNKYADPLVGDRSLASLTRYIDKQMPDDKPELCVGEDAKQVAKYIYDNFYSLEAQVRRNPTRVELARLTVGQYRNTIADLIGSFTGLEKPSDNDEHGLRVEYFNDGRGFNKDKRVLERIEPRVEVRFAGKDKPNDKIDKDEYAIRWSGSVTAPETGDYDFIMQTANGARLWVNDRDKPLIDAWVRSGDEQKLQATIRLLAGRTYHLKIEAGKEKKETLVALALRWKPPQRFEEAIPERLLSPANGSQWLVLQTPFPPDDNSLGYERGASISKAWDEATTQAAFEVASYIIEHMQRFTGARADANDAKKKASEFAKRFAERAFRRPLNLEQVRFFVDQHFDGDVAADAALKKSLVLMLKSPRFLFPGLGSDSLDQYGIAARLSYNLWDSLPDTKLLEAAKAGRLVKRDGVALEVERMMQDPRTRTKLRAFYHRWLKVDELRGLAKEPGKFPGFDDAFVTDLRTSLDLFLDEVTWNDPASDFRRLLQDDSLQLNGRLAKFYGADLPTDAPFTKVTIAGQSHAGVLTHPLLMAGFAYSATTSPIHRGVFVSRNLLGRRLRSPPDSIVPDSPTLNPDLTTRQRIGKQTKPPSCMACHDMINPLGFTMEGFDTVGRFRQDEKGKTIDTSGGYRQADGDLVPFKDARDLGAFLIRSPEAQSAFVERLFKDTVKQPILAYGAEEKELLRRYFVEHGFSIRSLLAEITVNSAVASSATASISSEPTKAASK